MYVASARGRVMSIKLFISDVAIIIRVPGEISRLPGIHASSWQYRPYMKSRVIRSALLGRRSDQCRAPMTRLIAMSGPE